MRRWYLSLVGAGLVWGTIPLIVRDVALAAGAIVFVRVWVAAAGLGVVMWLRRGRSGGPALLSVRPARCLFAAGLLAGHWWALFAAYQRAPAGTVILIVYLAPVGIAAAAPRALGEHLGRLTLAALAVAAAGFGLLAGPTARAAGAAGLLLSLAAAVLYVGLVLVSKPLAEAYGGLRLTFMEMAGAGVALIPVAATAHWGRPEASWSLLVVLGLVHTALATTVYLAALGHIPATHVGILSYIEPASVVAFAWVALSETPAVATVAGGVLITAAGALLIRGAGPGEPSPGGVPAVEVPLARGVGVPG